MKMKSLLLMAGLSVVQPMFAAPLDLSTPQSCQQSLVQLADQAYTQKQLDYQAFFNKASSIFRGADYSQDMANITLNWSINKSMGVGLCNVINRYDGDTASIPDDFFTYFHPIIASVLQEEANRFEQKLPFDDKQPGIMVSCDYEEGKFTPATQCTYEFSDASAD
jgi:hypothetical protein